MLLGTLAPQRCGFWVAPLTPASSGVFTRPCQYRPSVHACDVVGPRIAILNALTLPAGLPIVENVEGRAAYFRRRKKQWFMQ
jgi:hypothetical protein